MAKLGEFGAAQRELGGEPDTFVFCGETFTVEQPMPAMLILEVGAASSGMYDETQGFAAILRALQISLTVPGYKRPPQGEEKPGADGLFQVPDDETAYRRLHELAVEHAVGLEPLLRLVMALFEAQTGRPTQQASGSSPGPSPTSPSSNVLSTQVEPSSHLRSVASLVRGEGLTASGSESTVVLMGDGQLAQVEYGPERTG